MSKITAVNTIQNLTHDDAQITEHLGSSGKDAKALNLQTQLLKNRYVLKQLALKTYGTVVMGKPEFVGYFKALGAAPYKGANKWFLRLTSGMNQSAYIASNGDTVPNMAVIALHDYLIEIHAKALNEHDFLVDLDAAILTILPAKPKQEAKPKNALADAIGLICADFKKLTADQIAQLMQALNAAPKKQGETVTA